MIQVTSHWNTGNMIHKVKVFITTALRMTVPQTKQHFIDINGSTVVVKCKRSTRKGTFQQFVTVALKYWDCS